MHQDNEIVSLRGRRVLITRTALLKHAIQKCRPFVKDSLNQMGAFMHVVPVAHLEGVAVKGCCCPFGKLLSKAIIFISTNFSSLRTTKNSDAIEPKLDQACFLLGASATIYGNCGQPVVARHVSNMET